MKIEYIKEFVLLAQINSFSKTAELLGISQSTLSKHIKSLENELEGDLLSRTSKHVQITEFGLTFLDYAIQIAHIDEEYSSLVHHGENTLKNLTIAVSYDAMAYMDLLMIALTRDPAFSSCRKQFVSASAEDVASMIRTGRCNVGVVIGSVESSAQIISTTCFSDKLAIAFPLTPLSDEPQYINTSRTTELTVNVRKYLPESFSPGSELIVEQENLLMGSVLAGIGFAVVPRIVARYYERMYPGRIRVAEIAEEKTIEFNLLSSSQLKQNRTSAIAIHDSLTELLADFFPAAEEALKDGNLSS